MLGTLVCVKPHPAPRRLRRALLALAVLPAVTALTLPVAAVAAPPEQWEDAGAVSPLQFLLVLLLIPAGLFLVIALLAALPSMMRGPSSSYQPGLAWRNEPEWFGGPRDGLDKVDRGDQQALESTSSERGGASGSW
jgi:hypothetical protein